MKPPHSVTIHVAAAVQQLGGVEKFSRAFDVSEGHIKAVIEGRVMPGKRTLKAVGLTVTADGEIQKVKG